MDELEATPEAKYKPFNKSIMFHTGMKSYITVDIGFSEEGRLSITGDYLGGTGQIYDELLATYPVESARLVEIWKRWHLNDMRAGCEHQCINWDPSEELTVSTYKLTREALLMGSTIKLEAKKKLESGKSAKYTPQQLEVVNLPYKIVGDSPLLKKGYYILEKEEKITAGWVRPDEHPKGLLTKPCEVCGYKYGTKWLFEEVPEAILNELKEM
jgi:hypothetical protein